jgi:hypothetical protein
VRGVVTKERLCGCYLGRWTVSGPGGLDSLDFRTRAGTEEKVWGRRGVRLFPRQSGPPPPPVVGESLSELAGNADDRSFSATCPTPAIPGCARPWPLREPGAGRGRGLPGPAGDLRRGGRAEHLFPGRARTRGRGHLFRALFRGVRLLCGQFRRHPQARALPGGRFRPGRGGPGRRRDRQDPGGADQFAQQPHARSIRPGRSRPWPRPCPSCPRVESGPSTSWPTSPTAS